MKLPAATTFSPDVQGTTGFWVPLDGDGRPLILNPSHDPDYGQNQGSANQRIEKGGLDSGS